MADETKDLAPAAVAPHYWQGFNGVASGGNVPPLDLWCPLPAIAMDDLNAYCEDADHEQCPGLVSGFAWVVTWPARRFSGTCTCECHTKEKVCA